MLPLLNKNIFFSFFTKRKVGYCASKFFSKKSFNPIWNELSEKNRIAYSMATSNPENAEIAFYRGCGFKKLGPDYANDAITAFEAAAEMDSKYSIISNMQIGFVYESIGQFSEACKHFSKGCREFIRMTSHKNTTEWFSVMDSISQLTEEVQNAKISP